MADFHCRTVLAEVCAFQGDKERIQVRFHGDLKFEI
jgi:hypothetical protein